MSETEKQILVLGSAGFIGSALCRRLDAMGRLVYALGRAERTGVDGQVTHVRGSIEDRQLIRDALDRCQTVVYAASVTTPATSSGDPALEVLGNLLPLSRLLECAGEFPGRRIIYLSSGGTIYGDAGEQATESTPLRPRSYYGAGKVAAEALLHACACTSDWSIISLRPSNLYGPGQRVTKGFAIVPTLFDRANDGQTFEVWGDGSIVRDYCYIDDLVEAIILAIEAEASETFRVYNVASGATASILQLVEACIQASGKPIRTSFKPARGVDVARVSPRAERIASELGWKARVDLATGLQRTWSWHQQGNQQNKGRG